MITVVNANALQIPLPDQSVQCVITSPPYWSLRDYGVQNQIGLEPTPAAYVANIVRVMREVWRVCRPDATVWLNLGDSYASGEIGRHDSVQANSGNGWTGTKKGKERQQAKLDSGLKPKDLCGIPWRVAFALQDDGWYLRSDIIWHKPNPMPESVTDRPTKSHEYVFLLTKQARYYYDNIDIQEPVKPESIEREKYGWNQAFLGRHQGSPIEKRPFSDDHDGFSNPSGRNRRTVWTVATSPYSGAHFATFPPALVEPMILAGTSQRGACPTCGAGWVRVIELGKVQTTGGGPGREASGACLINNRGDSNVGYMEQREHNTLGWQPACACYAVPPLPSEPDDKSNGHYAAYLAERARLLELYAALPTVPCRVLDPFAGTATVGRVCAKHGRDFIGTELNPKYITLADERTSKIQITMPL